MAFLSRKLLSDDEDLKEFCSEDCLDVHCSSDCHEKCLVCSKFYNSIPPPYGDDLNPTSPSKSPHKVFNLVTITIALLSFIFLLVLCYAIYARFYSGRRRRRRHPDPPPDATHQQEFLDEDHGPVLDHPIWYIRTVGLPSAVIDAIAVCKFKSGEGLIDGTECSVCLSEFEEDETLRLLPKCSHAFHLPCIDTWLRSHTNCPMCRAPVVAPPPPPPPAETQMGDFQREEEDWANLGEGSGRNDDDEEEEEEEEEEEGEEEEEIDLPDEDLEEGVSDIQAVRRSVSLDSLSALRISSAFAAVSEKTDCESESKKQAGRGHSSAAMNRSVSCSGKLFLMRSSTQRSNGANRS